MPVLPRRNTMRSPLCRSVAIAANGLLSFSIGRFCTDLLMKFCSNSPLMKPRLGNTKSPTLSCSSCIAIFCRSKPLYPAAYRLPTTLPALVPTTISTLMPCASSALITPTCENPLAAPPPSASAIFGLGKGLVATGLGGSIFGGGSVAQPANSRPETNRAKKRRVDICIPDKNQTEP